MGFLDGGGGVKKNCTLAFFSWLFILFDNLRIILTSSFKQYTNLKWKLASFTSVIQLWGTLVFVFALIVVFLLQWSAHMSGLTCCSTSPSPARGSCRHCVKTGSSTAKETAPPTPPSAWGNMSTPGTVLTFRFLCSLVVYSTIAYYLYSKPKIRPQWEFLPISVNKIVSINKL